MMSSDDLKSLLTLASSDVPEDSNARALADEQCHDALDRIEIEQATIEAELSRITAQRKALLLVPGSRAALRKNDDAADELETDLERLGAVSEQLIALLRRVADRTRLESISDLIVDYTRVVDAWADATRLAAEARGKIIEMRERAVAAGFTARLGEFDMPDLRFAQNPAAIEQFRHMAIAKAQHQNVALAEKPEVFPITFAQSFPPYRAGETAGFEAGKAWNYVSHGVAVWADPRHRPPKPATQGGAR